MRSHAPRAHGETRVRSEQFLGEGFGHVAALRYDRRNRPARVGKQVANPGKALRMDFVKDAVPCRLAKTQRGQPSRTPHFLHDVVDFKATFADMATDGLQGTLYARIGLRQQTCGTAPDEAARSYLKDFPEWNRQVSFYTIPGIGHDCLRAFADPHFIDFVLGL